MSLTRYIFILKYRSISIKYKWVCSIFFPNKKAQMFCGGSTDELLFKLKHCDDLMILIYSPGSNRDNDMF